MFSHQRSAVGRLCPGAMAASSELLYDGEPLIAHSDGSAACLLCKCLLTDGSLRTHLSTEGHTQRAAEAGRHAVLHFDYFQGEPPKARAARMLLYATLAVVEWVTKRTT